MSEHLQPYCPECEEHVAEPEVLDRRNFIRVIGESAAILAIAGTASAAPTPASDVKSKTDKQAEDLVKELYSTLWKEYDERAAEAMGVNVFGLKLLAFAGGAFLAGMAGTVKAHQDGAVSPDQYIFLESAFLLAAIVLGGMGTIAGVLIGATILKLLPEKLRFFNEGHRLSGLDPRTTPELSASVTSISPDLLRDPATGVSYFSVRVSLSDGELERLPRGQHVLAGMPAEAFLRTSDRTVLTYLLGPIETQLAHAFRED